MGVDIHGQAYVRVSCQQLGDFGGDTRFGQIGDEGVAIGMEVCKLSGTVLVAQEIRFHASFFLLLSRCLFYPLDSRILEISFHHLGCSAVEPASLLGQGK